MRVRIELELRHGPNHSSIVSPRDFDAQIETLERIAATGRASPADAVQLLDTASILRGIQQNLADGSSAVLVPRTNKDFDEAEPKLRQLVPEEAGDGEHK